MCSLPPSTNSPAAKSYAAITAMQEGRLVREDQWARKNWEAALEWEDNFSDYAARNGIDLFPILAPIGDRLIAAEIALENWYLKRRLSNTGLI